MYLVIKFNDQSFVLGKEWPSAFVRRGAITAPLLTYCLLTSSWVLALLPRIVFFAPNSTILKRTAQSSSKPLVDNGTETTVLLFNWTPTTLTFFRFMFVRLIQDWEACAVAFQQLIIVLLSSDDVRKYNSEKLGIKLTPDRRLKKWVFVITIQTKTSIREKSCTCEIKKGHLLRPRRGQPTERLCLWGLFKTGRHVQSRFNNWSCYDQKDTVTADVRRGNQC